MRITLRLRDDDEIQEAVDLDRLTPRARAIAQAIATRPLRTPGTLLLRSDRPLRDMPAGQASHTDLWYTAAQMDAPDTVVWSSWSRYPADSSMPPEAWLELQAQRMPIGYTPIPDRDARPDDLHVRDARMLTRAQVLDVLRAIGQPLAVSTWAAMVSRGQAPRPDDYVGRTPRWAETTVRSWAAARPGRGARVDLTAQAEAAPDAGPTGGRVSLRFAGRDRRGTHRAGAAVGVTPAELAERLYTSGWREATLTIGGQEVGGIRRDINGHRSWYGEHTPSHDQGDGGRPPVAPAS